MFYLICNITKTILFWNARCACTTVKCFYIDNNKILRKSNVNCHNVAGYRMLTSNSLHYIMNLNYKKILICRNPIYRFVAGLYHPGVCVQGAQPINSTHTLDFIEKQIEITLETLENSKNKTLIEQHFCPQLINKSDENFFNNRNPYDIFDHIIKIEHGNLIEMLNQICGTHTAIPKENMNINNSKNKNMVLKNKYVKRLLKIYNNDFKWLYPEIEKHYSQSDDDIYF